MLVDSIRSSLIYKNLYAVRTHFTCFCCITESVSMIMKKGDLIILEDPSIGQTLMNTGWAKGFCNATGQRGQVHSESVHILPTLYEPPSDIVVSKMGSRESS